MLFERKKDELPPLKYKTGDKVMGYHHSIGGQTLVGGMIIDVRQSTSYLNDNEYDVKLEPDLCDEVKESSWWITEKDAQPFEQYVWDRAVKHWKEHCKLQRMSYLEYIKMHRALRREKDDISNEELEKELEKKEKGD